MPNLMVGYGTFLVRVFITNLKREAKTIKKKNLSTRIACRGSRLVHLTGLEPASLATYGPEPYVFASFTTGAFKFCTNEIIS